MSVAALERVGSVRGLIAAAMVTLAIGVGSIVIVMAGGDAILLGVGVAFLFASVLLLGPVLAKPIAHVLGAPVAKARGVTGVMARGNVQRNPRRTARTAAPVLIGVALVTGASVFAASIKEQIRDTVGETFSGDYVVNSTNGGAVSLGQSFVDDLNEIPEVAWPAAWLRPRRRPTASRRWYGVNPLTAEGLINVEFLAGDGGSHPRGCCSARASPKFGAGIGGVFCVSMVWRCR
jgi:hypothetical protein